MKWTPHTPVFGLKGRIKKVHTLIAGASFSGKSFLAKKICETIRKSGRRTIVLDPFYDNWDCDYKTVDSEEFLKVAKANTSCALFVDESGSTIGRGADAARMHWLATQARHWGHRTYFIMQRITQVEPLIRSQCSEYFVFRCSASDAKILIEETGEAIFSQAPQLPRFCFIHNKPFETGKIQKLSI